MNLLKSILLNPAALIVFCIIAITGLILIRYWKRKEAKQTERKRKAEIDRLLMPEEYEMEMYHKN